MAKPLGPGSGRNSNKKRPGRGGNHPHQTKKKKPLIERQNKQKQQQPQKEASSSSSNNNNDGDLITPNAIRKLILAEPYQGPLVVVLKRSTVAPSSSSGFVAAEVWDNAFLAPCLVRNEGIEAWLSSNDAQLSLSKHLLLRVTGYVTSTVNASGSPQNAFEPLLCLTSFKIIKFTSLLPAKRQIQATTSHEKVYGGRSAKPLHDIIPRLSLEDLAGASHVPFECVPGEHDGEMNKNQPIVQDFLSHHRAMKALQNSKLMQYHQEHDDQQNASEASADNASSTENNAGSNNTSTIDTQQQQQQQHTPQHELYFSALAEFATAQMDRQKASLTSNAGRATAADATKVVEQHKECMLQVLAEQALVSSPSSSRPSNNSNDSVWMTEDRLRQWHGKLCGNGLHAKAGHFRTSNVKAGRTVFGPAQDVLPQLQTYLLPALQQLETRITTQQSTTDNNTPGTLLVYAAAVFFGLVDLHPFVDGNGRLARMVGNGALHVAGIPFCVNWFATPAQRRDYVLATLTTRRNMSLVYRGEEQDHSEASQAMVLEATRASGAFFPLVSLLLDRVRKAIQEFLKLQHQKQMSVLEHTEAVAARRVRERAAAGSCLICLDDKPNIATLCCGRAVHLNCFCEWLSHNTTCPNCRGTMPALPPRPVRTEQQAALQEVLEGLEGQEEDQEEEDTTDYNDAASDNDEEGTTTFVDGDNIVIAQNNTIVSIHIREGAAENMEQNDSTTTEEDEEEDGDTTTVVVSNSNNNNQDDGAETSDDTTEEDTTTETAEQQQQQQQEVDEDETDDTTTTTDDAVGDEEEEATTEVVHGPAPRLACSFCNNRPAQECSNACCGACCISLGQFQCTRHGG